VSALKGNSHKQLVSSGSSTHFVRASAEDRNAEEWGFGQASKSRNAIFDKWL